MGYACPGQYTQVYETIKRDAAESTSCSVAILVALDADAIAASHILIVFKSN